MVQIPGKNSKLFCSMLSESVTKISPPFPQLPKDKRLKGHWDIMSIRNIILCTNSVTVSYLIILVYYYKLRQILQNVTAILLQNATK